MRSAKQNFKNSMMCWRMLSSRACDMAGAFAYAGSASIRC